MKFRSLAMISALFALPAITLVGEDIPEWEPIFNGKNLDGWKCVEEGLWTVEDETLVGRSPGIPHNRFLYFDRKVADFDLRYEVRLVGDRGNSGVQIRSSSEESGQAVGYQVDIGEGYWGSLYHEHGRGMLVHFKRTPENDPIKADKYNLFEVSARGHHITVKVNGVTTVDLKDPEGELEGYIAPQIHSGGAMEVRFRNILLREYKDPPGESAAANP